MTGSHFCFNSSSFSTCCQMLISKSAVDGQVILHPSISSAFLVAVKIHKLPCLRTRGWMDAGMCIVQGESFLLQPFDRFLILTSSSGFRIQGNRRAFFCYVPFQDPDTLFKAQFTLCFAATEFLKSVFECQVGRRQEAGVGLPMISLSRSSLRDIQIKSLFS